MKKSPFLRSVFVLLLSLCCVVSSLPLRAEADNISELKDEISNLKLENAVIQAQIDAIHVQADANASEIEVLVGRKNAVDQEIALLHAQIVNTNTQIRRYSQMIADSQEQLEAAQAKLEELNRQYKERIRAMEEQGELTYWQVVFQSRNFTDMLDRMTMVDEIAQADRQRLEDLQSAASEVEEYQRTLADERAELEETRVLLGDAEKILEDKRSESDDILRDLVSRQDEFQALIDESEALQDDLMREIASKQKELQAAQYKEELVRMALKGENPPSNASWRVPVSDYTITSPFGMRIHPVYKYARMHNGIDMACDTGTPIYATRAGTVTTASYQAGGAGYYVSINHGDGFASIYMHMTRYVVKKGDNVSQGQLIGYVGSTGVSTGPHLHFGISYGGTYVNPLAYIG